MNRNADLIRDIEVLHDYMASRERDHHEIRHCRCEIAARWLEAVENDDDDGDCVCDCQRSNGPYAECTCERGES